MSKEFVKQVIKYADKKSGCICEDSFKEITTKGCPVHDLEEALKLERFEATPDIH